MMAAHTFTEPLPLAMKLLNFMLPTLSFLLTATGLEIDPFYVALAAGSSMAGSLLFGFVRREKTFGAQLYKFTMATIGGLIVGSFVNHWRGYEAPAVMSLVFCLSSLTVLIFLKTIVSLTEENSRAFTVTLIERVFKIDLGPKEEKRRQRSPNPRPRPGVHLTEEPNGQPSVTIDKSATPDEINIVEQTVIRSEPPA